MRSNDLTGSIHTEFGIMGDLLDIELHDNDLTGTITEELYNMTKLRRLNLGYNSLSRILSTKVGDLQFVICFFNF